MLALLESLPEKYQPFRLYRMNRDLRFTKDKSPYKTQQGAISEAHRGDFYVHIDGRGLLVAAGRTSWSRTSSSATEWRSTMRVRAWALERILARSGAAGDRDPAGHAGPEDCAARLRQGPPTRRLLRRRG